MEVERIPIGNVVMETGAFTRVYIHTFGAKFTFNMTTPVEFAVTLIKLRHSFCIVAPPTTHDVTSVCSH